MDTKRLITAVLITMLVVFAFQAGLRWFGQQMGWDMDPRPPATQPAEPERVTDPTVDPTVDPTTAPVTPRPTEPTATAPAPVVERPALRVVPPTQVADAVQIGSLEQNHPVYRMAIQTVPQGAAIEQVVLNEFKAEVQQPDPYTFQRPFRPDADWTRSMSTRAVVIDGNRVELHNAPWTLESADSSSVTYSVTIEDDRGPVLRARKSYRLFDRTDAGAGYEIGVDHSLENLTDRALTAKLIYNGPVTPPREIERGPDRYIVAGYRYERTVSMGQHGIEEFAANQRVFDITQQEGRPLLWAGAISIYFNGLARPVPLDPAALAPEYIEKAEAIAFNPEADPFERQAGIVFQTTDLQLAAGQQTTLPTRVFFGPRQRRLLKSEYYAALGYNQILVLAVGCTFCTFQWLIDILVVLLGFFYMIFRDWGLAIIGLVFLVRLILHPVTKKSQVSMMKMAKLGPELQRLREKYGDNKEELNKAMMQFYRQQGATPILGCLPMFLQMPIWIALWSALNSTFELRHASFLYGLTWIHDLARPDHLIEFSRPFNIFFLHISGINLLPILMGVVFYIQMKIQPKPVSMTKEQEQQQKIMMWMMPLLFPILLYSGPSGLNLYILTSTLLGIIESKIVRDHVKRQEAAEAAQRVIVDAKPTRGSKKAQKQEAPPQKKTGIAGWLANLQEKAEQVRREAERKGK